MKKYIFLAVAGMLALSSCSNEDNDIQNEQKVPQLMTFTAGFGDDAQTRATLDPSTKKVSFDGNDQISILSANNTNAKFTTTWGGASATFTGTATAGDPMYYAIYPYQKSGLTLDSSTGEISGVWIPVNQPEAISSTCGWDPFAPVAYATTTGSSLTFHNVCALLKVTNNSGEEGDIYIFDPNYETAFVGEFTLNTSTGALTNTDDYYEVCVPNVPYGKTVYIAVAACTVKNLVADLDIHGAHYRKTKSTPTTFEAGKIYNLGNTDDWDYVDN